MPGSDHDRGENFTMAEAVCYAPSELARSINQLPFPGFGAAVGNLLGDGVVSAVLGNSISRAVFWGCFIVILTAFFMILTTVFYCCLYCLRKRCNQGSIALKLGCGGCSIVLMLACLAIIGVTYWAETTLDREFTVSSDGAGAVFGRNATAFETYVNAQRIRHWVVIGFLVVIILVLLLVILAVILPPVCKGNTTFPKIMLAILGVITVLTAVMAGLIFTITILHGDLCVTASDLFEQVFDGSLCRESDSPVQNPQNQRFSGICESSVGELYELFSSGSRCENLTLLKALGTLGGTNFCQTNISQLYQQLFQPLTFYCENQRFCRTSVETLTSEFLNTDCMTKCQDYQIGDVFQVFCMDCSSFLSWLSFLCDTSISGAAISVFTTVAAHIGCQNCESIGDLLQNFGISDCDSHILTMTLCQSTIDELFDQSICQQQVEDNCSVIGSSICTDQVEAYCSFIGSSICTDQPLLMRFGFSPQISNVNIFCNDALSSEFLLLIMVCVLIIALIIVQVAAAIYTTSFSADDSDSDYNSSGKGVTLKMKIFGGGGQAI